MDSCPICAAATDNLTKHLHWHGVAVVHEVIDGVPVDSWGREIRGRRRMAQ